MPRHVVVIGGGAIGSSVACFLARDFGVRVTVVERDPSYRYASSALSASSIRQQFSTAINIRISQASLAFYRRIGEELAVGDERPDIGLVEPGYLFLASAAGAETLRANHEVQRACGADVALLAPAELQRRFPWLAVEGVALASLGLCTATSGEGWFDGYSVLQAFRRKAVALGVNYVAAAIERMDMVGSRVVRATTADGAALEADAFVLAA
ncbi:MAG: NAD(P)/FAD-dependent oxidoreductase, partial [Pseudomonadota bacterium]